MANLTLKDIAEKMRDIDFCMLSTHGEGGQIAGRPMSNNREVEYDGDSFYFTWADSLMVSDIERERSVALAFQGKSGLFGKDLFLASIEGNAEVIRDKAKFVEHWTPELDVWFKDGVDTPNLALIKVRATRIHYWRGEDDGELVL
jgi:general stress protein 26